MGGDAPLLAWGDALRATKLRRRRLQKRIAVAAIGAAVVLGSAAFPPAPRLVWNASASAPIGLYSVSPGALAEPGDMVIARVPEPYRRLAATRRYLPMNVPLVKRVAAAAGDEVCALGQEIFVNGRWIAARLVTDGAGRPMPMWSGCVRLRGRQLFLVMDAPASFDGRYFGVTEGGDIIGKARLLWAR
ncbi:S26 family signal peptidase [Sphingomonas koreensis]|uniref:S26 family signal peptidase n=1 Tax=Sphingomonas koreensis TaxID=93064 RepID=A0A1L6J8G0_9SPHN|nr:S26 family signal peptidase [Sphingomonas koreensis]APR52127.1 S26 family signal peptidase [Sphingomonas koreensis]RSU22936.1 S26 family signal peptidase [Sphingomonas koreensis]RSU26801.1 S26 family signal peptidase [Sphingomonas koreensis]RSU30590.1 S26 family signal peptidase [Sphingomonas koreensis]RSU36955.1 S26 family signal peptidase [Sphingomonas koreensis]